MKAKFSLHQEGQRVVPDPSPSEIEAALEQIDPRTRSFYSLLRGDGSYVQVAGARLRLIIEYRDVSGDDFRHFVIGRESENSKMASLHYSGGSIALQSHEVMQIGDAIEVFLSFLDGGTVPDSYRLRDITAEFVNA